jgi:hypothetical protein
MPRQLSLVQPPIPHNKLGIKTTRTHPHSLFKIKARRREAGMEFFVHSRGKFINFSTFHIIHERVPKFIRCPYAIEFVEKYGWTASALMGFFLF